MSILDDARALAWRLLQREVPVVAEFSGLLDQLKAAERSVASARQLAIELGVKGLLTTADVQTYNRVRKNLYEAELKVYRELYQQVAVHAGETAARQLPAPQLFPALPSPPAGTVDTQRTALAGFGAADASKNPGAAVAAAPAAAAAAVPWAWIFGVIAALTALGILAYIASRFALSAESIASAAVAKTQSASYEQMLAERRRTYETCLARGSSPVECQRQAVALTPTPRDAMVEVPGSSFGPGVAIGLLLALVAGSVGWYFYTKRGGA